MASPAKIRLLGRGFDLSLRLGDEVPKPTAGGAIIEEEARPERKSLTSYSGDNLIRQDVPILLDGWKTRRSVQPQIDFILRVLVQGPPGQRPRDFIATGPIHYPGLRYIMEFPDFGDRAGLRGVVYRQELTLKLVEWVDPDQVTLERRDTGGGGGPGSGGKLSYTTKEGDTLIKIAAKLYGLFAAHSNKTAKQIGDLNGIRDIRKKLKAGRKLRLPRPPGT